MYTTLQMDPNSPRPLQPHVQNPLFRSPIQYGMMPAPQYYPSPRTPTSPIPHPFPTSPLPFAFYQRTPPPVLDNANIGMDNGSIGPPPPQTWRHPYNTATQMSQQKRLAFQQQYVRHIFQEQPGEPSILLELQQKLESKGETVDPKQLQIVAEELMMLWQTRIEVRHQRKSSDKSSEQRKNSTADSTENSSICDQKHGEHMEHKTIPHLEMEEYPNKRKGLVLIINNRIFKTKTERKGSEKDVEAATTFFSANGYRVILKEDRTAAEMKLDLDEFLNMPQQIEADCSFFMFLSHGCKSDMGTSLYGSDGNLVAIRKLLSSAQLCPSLKDKPKVFLIQACRGVDVLDLSFDSKPLANGIDIVEKGTGADNSSDGDNDEYKPEEFQAKKPVEPYLKDMFIWYSTAPGCKSFRNRKGSLFIQSVFTTLTKFHELETLQVLRSHVNRVVYELRSGKKGKQIPNGRDYLTKKFFV